MKRIHLFLLAFLILGLLFGFIHQPGHAQQADSLVEMQVEAAYQGVFKNGEWLPVYVTLENFGPDRETELRARITGGSGGTNYAVPVPLPAGARKRVPLYVLPNSFSREIEIQLYAGNELLNSATIAVQPQMNISFVVGILAPERGAMALIGGITLPGQFRPIVLVDLSLNDLPERSAALRSFDVLMLNDVDTSTLTQAQREALLNWVQGGGRLFIGGGAGAQKTISGLPENLLAFQPADLLEIDQVPELAEFAQLEEIRVPGPFLVAWGEVLGGKPLVQQAGITLIQHMEVGNGQVYQFSLDMAGSPFDAWSGTTPFWQAILSPGSAYPNWLPPDVPPRQMVADQMNYALSTLPALDLPSVRGLSLLLFVYVLLVGPVNYIVLRVLKRLHLAWVTIPALTLIFSAGTFGVGLALRGNDIILNKIALIRSQPDGTGLATVYFGLFSPAQTAYQVQVEGGELLSSITTYYDPWTGAPAGTSEITFVQGDPAQVRGLSVNQWSMQAFQSESVWPGLGNISADLRVGQEGITGELRNNTTETIRDAKLILGTRFANLGDLNPGAAVPVNLAMPEETGFRYSGEIGWILFEDQYSGPAAPPRDLEVKRTMVNAIFQNTSGSARLESTSGAGLTYLNQQPLFLGWLDRAPLDVKVNNRDVDERATSLVYQPLTYSLQEGDHVWLPVGMIPGGLTEYPQEGGNCGPDNSSVWLGRGDAIFSYRLPEHLDYIQPETLRLSMRSDGGWFQPPRTSLYDWSSETWVDLEGAVTGVNVVSDASRYVDNSGNIKVRLSVEVNQGGGCLFVELGMQGTRQ